LSFFLVPRFFAISPSGSRFNLG